MAEPPAAQSRGFNEADLLSGPAPGTLPSTGAPATTPARTVRGEGPPAHLLSPSQAYEAERRSQRSALATRIGEEVMAWVKTFASAAVYATLIVTFGFQVARVEGKSMEPTLEDQDRLIVNKAIYRFFGVPVPGDIVMLYYPRDPDKSFVKRVIAMEGDTVRIEDGRVYVNEVLLPDEYVPPDFRSHENHGPEVVQEAHYFVMGDHRNNSSDSRHWGQADRRGHRAGALSRDAP